MRKIIFYIILGWIIILTLRCSKDQSISNEKRSTITFILSEDSPGKNYFSLAREHYSQHPEYKTDFVTGECRSIGCVIDRLNKNKEPWAVVNLVAHGNSKTGLNLYLSDDGHKATPKRMVQEVILKNLPSLKSGVVDSNTHINILGCGIGTNPMISLSSSQIFAPVDGASPKVNCSKGYVVFREDANGTVQCMEANYWPYYYRRGYRPSISEIDAEMKKRYPQAEQDWSEKLSTANADEIMDYHIPVSYLRKYSNKNDRPKLQSMEQKINWVKNQPEIMNQIKDIGLTIEDFHWRVDKRILRNAEGEIEYAVKAIGMTTVLCFLDTE